MIVYSVFHGAKQLVNEQKALVIYCYSNGSLPMRTLPAHHWGEIVLPEMLGKVAGAKNKKIKKRREQVGETLSFRKNW